MDGETPKQAPRANSINDLQRLPSRYGMALKSKPKLEALLNQEIAHFAYPNGDFGAREIAAVRRAGFHSARTILPGPNRANTDPLTLHATVILDEDSVNVLCGKLSGLFQAVERIARHVRRGT